MLNIKFILAILTVSVTALSAEAAEPIMPAPLPGPYYAISLPTMVPTARTAQPYQQPQPYWMQAPRQQMPYWMQNPQRQLPANTFTNPPATVTGTNNGAHANAGIGFGAQTTTGGNNFRQGFGSTSAPGYFPGYGSFQPTSPLNNPFVTQPSYQQQSSPQFQGYNGSPYPNQQNWNGQWGQGFPNWNGFPFAWQR